LPEVGFRHSRRKIIRSAPGSANHYHRVATLLRDTQRNKARASFIAERLCFYFFLARKG
jgi:hypothetical protein